MSTNQAAWIEEAGKSLVVKEAPDWPVEKDQIKIRNRAVAVNPADVHVAVSLLSRSSSHLLIQSEQAGFMIEGKLPFIAGFDLAGEIISVGSEVTKFKIGDRVIGFSPSFAGNLGAKSGAFQLESVVPQDVVAALPQSWSFVEGCVLPAATGTAAAALYPESGLALDIPTVPVSKSNGKSVLVWGASSSVGSVGVLMLVQAGYEVLATCSSKNFDYVKHLGVKHVFDYNSASVIEDLLKIIKPNQQNYAGAFVATQDPAQPLQAAKVAAQLDLKESRVCTTNPRFNREGLADHVKASACTFAQSLCFARYLCPYTGFSTQIFPSYVAVPGFPQDVTVGEKIWADWLPKAMEARTIRAVPSPVVVGKGLEAVQMALDRMAKGVSAEKLVVEL